MGMKQGSLRNDMANARGLGSAKDGFEHWWLQRVTAIANIPLTIWFIFSLLSLIQKGGREVIAAWFADPLVAIASLALFLSITLHARLGLQVVIEDYIHNARTKLFLRLLTKFAFIGAAIIAGFAIIKLHFFGI